MHLHLLFPIVKTAALYVTPFKSDSKNIHPSFILKWAVVMYYITETRLQLQNTNKDSDGTVFRGTVYREPSAVPVRYGMQIFWTVQYDTVQKSVGVVDGTGRYAFFVIPSVSDTDSN